MIAFHGHFCYPIIKKTNSASGANIAPIPKGAVPHVPHSMERHRKRLIPNSIRISRKFIFISLFLALLYDWRKMQLAFLLHGKNNRTRYCFIFCSLAGLLLCEIGWQLAHGWHMLFGLVIWFFCLTFFFSAIFCTILYSLFQKYHKKG